MRLFLGTVFFVLLGASNIYAEMVAVSSNLADIRSSPSTMVSSIILQVPRYYPLSAQQSRNDFLEVTDYNGNIGWILKSSVDNTRTVIVNASDRANVRKGPGTDNEIAFKAANGVCFKVLGEKDRWLNVEHETGVKGWIAKSLVWGN